MTYGRNRSRRSPAASLLALAGAMLFLGRPAYARYADGDGADKGGAGGDKGAEPKLGADGKPLADPKLGPDGKPLADDKGADPDFKRKYDALMEETKQKNKVLQELKGKISDMEGRTLSTDELTEYRRLKDEREAAEIERKKAAGQFEQLVQENKAKHEREIAEAKRREDSIRSELYGERINNVIAAVVPKYTAVPVEDIAPLIRKHFSTDKAGRVILVAADGTPDPANADTGKPYTFDEFVKEWIGKKPHFAAVRPASGSGGGSQGGGSGQGGKYSDEDIARIANDPALWATHKDAINAQVGGHRTKTKAA